MAMEFDLNDDPMTYEARPVFGKFSPRTFATIVVCGAVACGLAVPLLALGLDTQVIGIAVCALCVPVGAFGVAKFHGLRAEAWVPLVRAEMAGPTELRWAPPRPVVETPASSRREARARERAERAFRREASRAAARESELDDLLGQAFAGLADDRPDTDTTDEE